MEETVSVPEAARRLGMTTEEAYTLVFLRELRSVEAPSGRRIIPIAAIDRWKSSHPTSA
jgi:hypothetical protein